MSLDALAPDQRAVVQLVLQQDRSYDELAGLLGISSEAVRERAHRGLQRLAADENLDPADRAEITDYLLGQQSVSRREATRSLLTDSAPARAWARSVAGELRDVARSPLPEIPAEGAPEPEAAPEPEVAPEPEPAPTRPVRARPRPRPDRERPGAAADEEEPALTREPRSRPAGAKPRSNLLGGALLIGGLAIVLVALVVWLVSRGGNEDDPGTQANNATPTPTATATVQPIGQLELTPPDGGEARGQMVLFATADGIAFTVQGTDLPESGEGEAYAVWLIGGELNRPRRLGYAPPVEANGNFGTSGPREQDAQRFPTWFSQAAQVVVSRETAEDASQPGPIVLAGDIPRDAGAGAGDGDGG